MSEADGLLATYARQIRPAVVAARRPGTSELLSYNLLIARTQYEQRSLPLVL
jgi:hypothetical protein